jgi:MFS family permease
MSKTRPGSRALLGIGFPPGRFGRWWISISASSLGDGIRLAAIPLAAASVSHDPTAVAGATIAVTLPFLLFALVSGSVVDRLDRRRIMVWVSFGRGLVLLFFALAALGQHMNLAAVYLLALVMGTSETLFDNAAQSILPSLVPDEELDSANGRMTATVTAGYEFVGPASGSFLFSLGRYVPFATASVLSLFAGILAAFLPASSQKPGGLLTRRSIPAEIAEGLRWVWGQSSLYRLAVITAIIGLTDSAWYGILVLYAVRILHLDPFGYGLLLSAGGLGGVTGGVVAGRAASGLGASRAIMLAVAGMGVSQLLLGVTSAPPLAFAALILSTCSISVFNALAVATRQRLTPAALLGRTNSVFRFLGLGTSPLGAALGGFLASSVNLRAPFLAGAPFVLVVAVSLRLPAAAGPSRRE